MSKIQLNYQDLFLNYVRKTSLPVIIYMVNKFQVKGIVKAFDSFVVVLEVEGNQQMIYKHAISTIVPTKEMDILNEIKLS